MLQCIDGSLQKTTWRPENYLPPPSPNLALPQAPYLLLFKASARKYLFVLAS
jgi:hypothetical protein